MKTKQNDMSKTIIIVSIIIGISILGFGFINYQTKLKTLEVESQKEEETRTDKRLNLINCNKNAESDYLDYWNAQCKVQGRDKKTDNCSLPKYIADDVEARRQKSLDNCVKLYGN
jgi:hypothetical protein